MKMLHGKEIISCYGWPSMLLVGDQAAKAAWLVVGYSVSDIEFMATCVGLLEDAVTRDDVEAWQLAFLQNRSKLGFSGS